MTTCEFMAYLQAYCDGELEASKMLEVEAHVRTCPSCRRAVEVEGALREGLRARLSREPVPPLLQERLRDAITELEERQRDTAVPAAWPRRAWLLALAASILLLTLGGVLGYLIAGPSSRTGHNPLVADLVSQHLRFSLLENPAELSSRNTQQVAFWVQGRIGHRVRVPDYSSSGIDLLGGGVTRLSGHQAAYIVYEKGRNIISLFAFPQYGTSLSGLREIRQQCMAFRTVEYRGQQILLWESDEMTYAMVANVGWDELYRCAQVFFEAKKS